MTFDIVTLAIIGSVCLLFGVLLGVLLGSAIRSARTTSKTNPNRLELARLWRDRNSGRLVVEVEEEQIETPKNLDPSRLARLVDLLAELRQWLGAAIAAQSQPDAWTARPETPAMPILPPVDATAPGVLPLFDSPAVSGVPVPQVLSTLEADTQPKVKPPTLVDALARALTPKPSQEEPPKSIAVQVDEILQEKLLSSPLRERGIRLVELPDKGLVVWVGLEEYEGVDQVPDPQVQEIIHQSVKEWEKRMGVG